MTLLFFFHANRQYMKPSPIKGTDRAAEQLA